MIAAERLGFLFVGIEQSPEYVETIHERLGAGIVS